MWSWINVNFGCERVSCGSTSEADGFPIQRFVIQSPISPCTCVALSMSVNLKRLPASQLSPLTCVSVANGIKCSETGEAVNNIHTSTLRYKVVSHFKYSECTCATAEEYQWLSLKFLILPENPTKRQKPTTLLSHRTFKPFTLWQMISILTKTPKRKTYLLVNILSHGSMHINITYVLKCINILKL